MAADPEFYRNEERICSTHLKIKELETKIQRLEEQLTKTNK